jgi:hypothetical protein
MIEKPRREDYVTEADYYYWMCAWQHEEIGRLNNQTLALVAEISGLRRELAEARNRQSCDNGQPWVCHALATARSELAETKDQRSSLLATNYDLRKERDRLMDEIAFAIETLKKHDIHLESKNCWCGPCVIADAGSTQPPRVHRFRSTP